MKKIYTHIKSYHQLRRKLIAIINWNTGQKALRKVSIVLTFLDIMEFTADRIDNDKNILPSLLRMFNIKCWWNPREDDLKQT